ncbi:MAG: decaprenyl-phosphate phosphoribosyltransferase [Rhodocyclaceae bacterium]|nr:decaprenyl-phosphate phosphoribosyltransferase [Rhodocyclaceae bacterium]
MMNPAIALLRPHQWVKNLFVFAGLLFGHAWMDHAKLSAAIWAFVAFSLLASAVYVLNDLVDREQDRQHPKKKFRPLAAGTITVPLAIGLGLSCLALGSVVALTLAGSAPWVFFVYLGLNIAYTFWLKHVVILDVFVICAGFMLRLLAGTVGIGIVPSQWLLLCGLLLTLFLGFAKRRSELAAGEGKKGTHRRVLAHYSAPLLDQFIAITAAGTIVAYALYTVSAETLSLHGTRSLIYTVPFVLYGMFRYLWRLHAGAGGGDAAQDLLSDGHLLGACAGWLILVVCLIA